MNCYECGAEYFAATCAEGFKHTIAQHNEGACSQWSDVAEWLEHHTHQAPRPIDPEAELPF